MAKAIYDDMKKRMGERIDALSNKYGRLRAGRANPQLVQSIVVDYYGTPTPLGQMASISLPEARTIEIQPYDISALKEIEKAINISDLGIPPQNNGKVIRIMFPTLTEETRKELAKEVKALSEEAKVFIRNIRREGNVLVKELEDAGDLTEDQQRRAEEEIQKITDDHTKKAEELSDKKEKEIMSV